MQGSFPGGKIKRNNNESPLGSQQKVKGRGNVKQLFESLNGGDREFVLDKIHQMRLKSYEKRGGENLVKPHYPLFNDQEKMKLIEQYQLAKQQLHEYDAQPSAAKTFSHIGDI